MEIAHDFECKNGKSQTREKKQQTARAAKHTKYRLTIPAAHGIINANI